MNLKFVIALGAVVFAGTVLAPTTEVHAESARVPLIRLYNARTTAHFYTTSRDEATAASKAGFNIEGEMGYIYATQTVDSVPLYRLYNRSWKRHFYTTNAAELAAVTRSGFTLEGIMGYVYLYANDASPTQVYRLFNKRTKNHFYTTNSYERDYAVSHGYVLEGSLGGRLFNSNAATAVTSPQPPTQPVPPTVPAVTPPAPTAFNLSAFPYSVTMTTGVNQYPYSVRQDIVVRSTNQNLTDYKVTFSGDSSWFSVNGGMIGSINSSNPLTITAVASTYNLSAGNYSASIDVTSAGVNLSIPVYLAVTTPFTPAGLRVGTLVRSYLDGVVYVVGQTGLYRVTSMDVFNSWNIQIANIVLANTTEQGAPVLGIVPVKLPGCSTPLDQINGLCGNATAR